MTEVSQDGMMQLATSLEQGRMAAMVAGKIDDFAAMLAPDLSYAHSNGLWDSRESLLEKLNNGTILYHRADATVEAAIALGPDALMARGTLELAARVAGVERLLKSIYLVVWIRGAAGWLLVGHQSTSAA